MENMKIEKPKVSIYSFKKVKDLAQIHSEAGHSTYIIWLHPHCRLLSAKDSPTLSELALFQLKHSTCCRSIISGVPTNKWQPRVS